MTDNNHPITPPPELVQEWIAEWSLGDSWAQVCQNVALVAACWGADQELEACCAIAVCNPVCGTKHQRSMLARHIRELRRPKPLSLKEQAKEALGRFFVNEHTQASQMTRDFEIIRRAVESLPD